MFSVCDIDNMNSNAINKTHTGPRRVGTQEPEEEQETPTTPPCSTPSSPTKAAKDAPDMAVASLPTSLHPLILQFGNKIITACCKRYAKKSIMQQMQEDTSYVPCSTKATDFKITLSTGVKEDKERVSFLEQQIQQAKDSYESSLKTVIEECIPLEIQAAKKEESQLIMDLFPAIEKAIQQLQGTECSEHLQTVNTLKMMPTLLQYGPIVNIINFLHFYQNHHSLDEITKPTLRTMDDEYATIEERTKAMQHHTASLQCLENSRIQLYTKCLKSILVTPTASNDKQIEENKCILNVKKLSNEIIMGKSMEETAMELDRGGAANFEQLQDLIRKECDKCDRKCARLEYKYNKLEQQVTKKDPKNMPQRGQPSNNEGTGASKKNKFNKRQSTSQPNTHPRSAPPNNPGQQKRVKLRKPRTSRRKKQRFQAKNENKHTLPSQNKSTQNPYNTAGKKKPPKTQQQKN